MRTIAVVALKGSQTKTTSTINMAACLAGQGGACSSWTWIPKRTQPTSYSVAKRPAGRRSPKS